MTIYVPSTPGAPSFSRITQISARATWTSPSNWGGDDWRDVDSGRYDIAWAEDSAFTMLVVMHNSGDNQDDVEGLLPGRTYWAKVRAKNDAGPGNWSSARSFTTLPGPPAAPTGVAATRQSDTQHTISWTPDTSGGAYTSQRVYRTTIGSYALLAPVGGSVTSFVDTTTAPDHRYAWWVAGLNASGEAGSALTAFFNTTPAAPTNASAVKTAIGDVLVTWTNQTSLTGYTHIELEHSTDGGANWHPATTLSDGTATEWTDTAPNVGSNTYRVRAVSTDGAPTSSDWATTATIATAAPPNAPTDLSPNGATIDLSRAKVLTWKHNPTDTSPQSSFELEHAASPAGPWTSTGRITSTTSSWTLPAGTYPNTVDPVWRVRTWGQLTGAGDCSPYSATATVSGSSTPTVVITTPANGATVGTSSVTVALAYFQAEGVPEASWRLTVSPSAGAATYSGADNGNTATVTNLADGTTYTLTAQVQSADGLWSDPDVHTITIDYLPPALIDLEPVFDPDTGFVTVNLYPQTPDGVTTLQQVGAYVERQVPGGPWQPMHEAAIDPRSGILDPTAPTNGSVAYRVTAVSAVPSSVTGPLVHVDTGSPIWFYLSDGLTTVCRVANDVKVDRGTELDTAVSQFEDRPLGVEQNGTAITRTFKVTGKLDSYSSSPDEWHALAEIPGPWLWRGPKGDCRHVQLSGLSVPEDGTEDAPISFNLREVDSA